MSNRRDFIKQLSVAGLLSLMPWAASDALGNERQKPSAPTTRERGAKNAKGTDPLRGPFPILSTPYLETGAVDYETLGREARFVGECGCPGVIWPQSADSCDLLTTEEKHLGMEAIAKAMTGMKTHVTFGCQGRTTAEMAATADYIEKLAARHKKLSIAVISRPPDNSKTDKDLEDYYETLARHIRRPAIIQTTGGTAYQGKAPSVELMVRLAERHPDIYGYIKEEAEGTNERIAQELSHRPTVKTVFSAWGGHQWLYQSRQLGTEGLITERPAYADLVEYIWVQMENGDKYGTLDDAFAKYLLMVNLSQSVPDTVQGGDLRGPSLYVLKKRGVFKNYLTRAYDMVDGKKTIPGHIILKDLTFTQEQVDEIEYRFESLKPYLRR